MYDVHALYLPYLFSFAVIVTKNFEIINFISSFKNWHLCSFYSKNTLRYLVEIFCSYTAWVRVVNVLTKFYGSAIFHWTFPHWCFMYRYVSWLRTGEIFAIDRNVKLNSKIYFTVLLFRTVWFLLSMDFCWCVKCQTCCIYPIFYFFSIFPTTMYTMLIAS